MSPVDVWLRRTHNVSFLGMIAGSLVILYTMVASAPGMPVIDLGYGLLILSALTMAAATACQLVRGESKTRPRD